MKLSLQFFLLIFISILSGCKKDSKNSDLSKIELEQDRPNIIFIMADDHAVQAISAYGHEIGKVAPTPNIDRLARNGAVFQKNFCTNSICGPSRAVILTGKHSHINGFRMNGEKFDNSQQTFPKILQENGYQTAIIGKWHLHGFPTGFDYWKILNDQGKYYNPEFIEQKDTVNLDKEYVKNNPHWAINMKDTAIAEGYATDLITNYSIDWMEKRDKMKPFYLMVHHKAPHRNWMPALRHLNLYDSVQFPVPDTYFSKHPNQKAAQQQLQTVYKDMYEGHDLKMSKHHGTDELASNPWTDDFERMTPEQRKIWNTAYREKNDAMHDLNLSGKEMALYKLQRYLQEYMATIASVDEGVGKILDYLEKTGLDKNTLVIYNSDQGFYLGEKGWFDKRFMYEESFKMPLLMQFPKKIKPNSTVNGLTQNLDFAPTILDFAGIKPPQDMQGVSFKNLFSENDMAPKREAIYYHFYDFPAFHMVKRHYGVRTERYKLIHFYDDIDQWEFYDLKEDPKELKNLYGEIKYQDRIDKMKSKLDSLQRAYKVTEKEFETSTPESVKRAYKNFEKLRGERME
ncbi:sulfatase family protein [Gillisia marina]|uniref:sulfatase family protein n=1 Tax=Gillisia marina TaxID=1167637 RepID=UPI00029A26F9|nr:sulfatase [Gillisia marina]